MVLGLGTLWGGVSSVSSGIWNGLSSAFTGTFINPPKPTPYTDYVFKVPTNHGNPPTNNGQLARSLEKVNTLNASTPSNLVKSMTGKSYYIDSNGDVVSNTGNSVGSSITNLFSSFSSGELMLGAVLIIILLMRK